MVVAVFALGSAALLALLGSYQAKMIYLPRPYGSGTVGHWDAQPGTTIVEYGSAEGTQRAYLLSRTPQPRRLWFVCGGNGSLALDWADWLRDHAPAEDAYLMFDMPAYGECTGQPDPSAIRKRIRAAVPAAAAVLGWTVEPGDERLRFFGHSLGSAVALIAADEWRMGRGVLLTPFTSTMDMARIVTGLPVGFLVRHRFDNRARLEEIAARGPGLVFVVHGTDDEVIPYAMAQDLARGVPGLVRLETVEKGMHNNLTEVAEEVVMAAMRAAGE